MAAIKLPDGSVKDLPDGTTVGQLAESIGRGLAKAAIVGEGGREAGRPVRTALVGEHDVSASFLRHSTAHVLAEALRHLYGAELQYTIGPVIEKRVLLRLRVPRRHQVLAEDLPEGRSGDGEDHRRQRSRSAARTCRRRRQKSLLHGQSQRFKDEIIDELEKAGEPTVSIYRQGDFTDLCRGPHIPSHRQDQGVQTQQRGRRLLARRQQPRAAHPHLRHRLLRQEATRRHTKQQEEAKKRDHRVLGPRWGCSPSTNKSGQGLVLWKPKGAEVRIQLQNFISEHLRRQGYSQVFTPHIGRLDLYKTSGHFPYYRDSQFPPIMDREFYEQMAKDNCGCAELSNRMEKGDIDGYLLKPMNCPHHIRIYASDPHSYRDLPIRLAEFGTVYRWEKSGELGGMTRVRGFTQDDAHLFCTEEQVPGELLKCLELVKIVLTTLGMNDYRVRVGLRDPDSAKYVGDPAQWDRAEAACKEAAKSLGVSLHRRARRGGVLRPQDRLRRPRCHRPRVAAGHRAGRLPAAPAVRPDLHRRRQQTAPAGDDPPRPVRLHGAFHRRADRALRRRVPALAGTGAGDRAVHQ